MDDGSWKREGEPAMMVQPDSAKLFWPQEESIPCHVDHSQIAKLERGESGIFPSISWAVKSAIEKQTTPGLSRLEASDDVASKKSSKIHHERFESGSSRSFDHAGNTPLDKEKGPSIAPAARSRGSVTPEQLCAAVRDWNVEEVEELLARGCSVHSLEVEDPFMDPDDYHREGKDPYLLAAFLRQENILRLLLEHGADSFRTGPFGITALHAVFFKVTEKPYPPLGSVVALLLQHRPPLEQVNNDGMTPLMCSVRFGYLASTKILLDHGANVHVCDNLGETTLHHAVLGKNPDIVALLVRKGVDVNANAYGWRRGVTALHLACAGGSVWRADTVKVLLEAGAENDAIGEEPNQWGQQVTPLHVAAHNGNADVINTLMAFGANIEAENSQGWKALHYAFHNSHLSALKTLLDHGALVVNFEIFSDSTRNQWNFDSHVSEKRRVDCDLLMEDAMHKEKWHGRNRKR